MVIDRGGCRAEQVAVLGEIEVAEVRTEGGQGDVLEVGARTIGALEGGDEGASCSGSDCKMLYEALKDRGVQGLKGQWVRARVAAFLSFSGVRCTAWGQASEDDIRHSSPSLPRLHYRSPHPHSSHY